MAVTTRTLEIRVNQAGNAIAGLAGIAAGIGAVVVAAHGLSSVFDSLASHIIGTNAELQSSTVAIGTLLDNIAASAQSSVDVAAEGMSAAAISAAERVRDVNQRVQDAMVDHGWSIAGLQEDIAEASSRGIEDRQRQLYDSLQSLAEQHADRIRSIQEQIGDIQASFDEQMRDRQQDVQDRIDDLTENHESSRSGLVARLRSARNSAQRREIERQIAEEDEKYNKQVARMQEREAKEVERAKRKHEQQMAALQKRLDEENSAYEKQQKKLQSQADDDLARIRENNAKRVAELEKMLAREETLYGRQMRDLQEATAFAAENMSKALTGTVTSFVNEMDKAAKAGKFYSGLEYSTDALMAWIKEKAKALPGTFTDTSKSAMQLMAYNLDPTRWLVPVGAIEAVFGAPKEQIVRAFGDMAAGATGVAVREFANMGIVLKNIPGLKFDAQGALVTPVEEAMTILEGYLNERFVPVMDNSGNTWKRVVENLTDTWDMFVAALGKPIFDWLNEKLVMVRDTLDSHPEYLQNIIDRFGELWEKVEPILDDVAELLMTVVNNILAGQNPLEAIKNGLDTTFGPDTWQKIQSVIDGANRFLEAIGHVVDFINRLSDAFTRLGDFINRGIEGWRRFGDAARGAIDAVPSWLIPHSPTAFEVGLRGIGEAMKNINNIGFNPSQDFGFGGSAPTAGAVTVNLTYAPVVSLADRYEAEQILAPMIVNALRGRV